MFKIVFDKECTMLFSKGRWYHRYINRKGQETIFMVRDKSK